MILILILSSHGAIALAINLHEYESVLHTSKATLLSRTSIAHNSNFSSTFAYNLNAT